MPRKKKTVEPTLRHHGPLEEERWTIEEPAPAFGKGWVRKLEYSFTQIGTFSKLTFITDTGKKFRYNWQKSAMTREKIEARGFGGPIKKTVRRKPKAIRV